MKPEYSNKIWGQVYLDLGTKWRTCISKVFTQKGRVPRYSLNGKFLREAIKQGVKIIEVSFPERGYVISKTPQELLRGEKVLKVYNQPNNPMDMYWHDVDMYFPRLGKKKDTYQAIGQQQLI